MYFLFGFILLVYALTLVYCVKMISSLLDSIIDLELDIEELKSKECNCKKVLNEGDNNGN